MGRRGEVGRGIVAADKQKGRRKVTPVCVQERFRQKKEENFGERRVRRQQASFKKNGKKKRPSRKGKGGEGDLS